MNAQPAPATPGIGATLVSARSYAEYTAMFALVDADLTGRVLDCPGGAASFTAGCLDRGIDATAVDPAYAGGAPALAALGAHAEAEAARGHEFMLAHASRFVWTWFTSPQDHLAQRTQAASDFAASARAHPERYLPGALPHLPFPDATFDLVLSSHLLFTYGDRLDDAFHLAALRELARVARGQVRIFPLLGHVDGRAHPSLDALRGQLAAAGTTTTIRASAGYEFQAGGDQMLVLHAPTRRWRSHSPDRQGATMDP